MIKNSTESLIQGVGRDVPIKADGSGTALPFRFDLIPPHSQFGIAAVYAHGFNKYARCPEHLHTQGEQGPPKDCRACATVSDSGWKERVTAEDHLNHILTHAMAILAGDTSDDHADHLACRATMLQERLRLDKLKAEKERQIIRVKALEQIERGDAVVCVPTSFRMDETRHIPIAEGHGCRVARKINPETFTGHE